MNVAFAQQQSVWIPRLRPYPAVAEAALRTLSVGELDASTLALVIGADPALSAALVRASEPSDSEATIADRVAGLTPSRLQSALFAPLSEAFTSDSIDVWTSDNVSWRRTLALAIVAEFVARKSARVAPGAAYLAGLMLQTSQQAIAGPNESPTDSVRAIARAYRFPRWLLDTLESANLDQRLLSVPMQNRELLDVLTTAAMLAPEIAAERITPVIPESPAAKRLGLNAHQLHDARNEAAESFARRLTLFQFRPAPIAELRGSLLRFANHLLLNWRVDESSADVLRRRVDHLEAITQFQQAALSAVSLEELAAISAAGIRASLDPNAGVCALWTDALSAPIGLRWEREVPACELMHIHHGHGLPVNVREIHKAVFDSLWQSESDDQIPSVLPIRTPDNRHCGYLGITTASAPTDRWLECFNAWATALGAAVERTSDSDREARNRDILRKAVHAVHAEAATPTPDHEAVLTPQRNLARATTAALHGPLSAITSQAHQLISQISDAATQNLVEDIAKQARNAARVVADLQVVGNSANNPLEPVLINAPLRQFLQISRPRLERRAIALIEQIGEGLPRIKADARKLHHLFTNLVAYIEQRLGSLGRALTVSTTASDDRTAVLVRFDVTGLPMHREQAESLFTPFEDAESSASEHALCLASCRFIVHEFGGTISAMETDIGAVFTLSFPAIVTPATLDEVAEPVPSVAAQSVVPIRVHTATPEPDSDTSRVLIVDDDEGVRDIIRQALKLRGYQTEIARDGVEAMLLIKQMRIDAILLDLLMPQRDGFAMLRDLQRVANAPPVVFMTGSGAPDVREEALSLGATLFLKKPFELRQLLAELDSVLVTQRA